MRRREEKILQLKEMLQLVDEAEHVLTNKNVSLDEFGRLLNYSWKLKQQTGSRITTNDIDNLYNKGIQAGAIGGKLLGAGGGGFLIFYVNEDRRESVMKAMDGLLYIPFKFETDGTSVIHYTYEDYIPFMNTSNKY
jgi:D-glycero-alpha-D-manno-heptose-7-phosphate kinase